MTSALSSTFVGSPLFRTYHPDYTMNWMTLNFPITRHENEVVLTGLRLSRDQDGRLVVVAVDRNLQNHEHALEDVVAGMVILKIQNVDTPGIEVLQDEDCLASTRTRLTGLQLKEEAKMVTLVARHGALSSTGLITANIYKPKETTKTGIGFWQQDPEVDTGHVLIDKIIPGECPSVKAPLLKEGYRVISINNKLAYNSKETANVVRSTSGLLTLLVQTPQETKPLYDPVVAPIPLFVLKSYQGNNPKDTGLTVELQYGKVIITELSRVFSSIKNELRVGMELISINNVTVETPEMVQDLLTASVACALKTDSDEAKQQNVVTICAQTVVDPMPGTMVTLSVMKQSEDSKLGLVMGMQMPPSLNRLAKDYKNNGHVVIRRVTEDGLLAKALAQQSDDRVQLQPGMVLHQVTIQGRTLKTKGFHNRDISAFLRTAGKGHVITFLAEVPIPGDNPPATTLPPHIFKAMDAIAITKKLPDQNVGMTLNKNEKIPQVLVQQVEEGCLAAASGVKVGMQILKVNNVAVNNVLDVISAISQVEAGVPLTLLVQRDAASLIPPVVTGSVYKETRGSKVGIKLRKYKGGSAVVGIKEDSISANTDLLGGLMLQSINNIEGEDINETEKAANMLIDGQGDITICAVTPEVGVQEISPYITATVVLSNDNDLQEGIFTYKDGKVLVSEKGMNGMFKGTSLRVGMEVLTLNNVDVALLSKPEGIMAMFEPISDQREVVTILAKKVVLPPPSELFTATVFKETCESRIGLTYVVDNTKKKTVITRIDDAALAASTQVLPGMEVLAINNNKVQGLDRAGVAKLFAEASGVVTYIGKTHDQKWAKDDRILLAVTIDKGDKSGPIGVKLIKNQYDQIKVASIEEGSAAAGSDLIPGLVLHTVNNKSCVGKSVREIAGLLDTASGMVTVLAEASPLGEMMTVSLVKDSPDTKLGVTMIQRNARVLIKKFVPNSLCEASDLEIGMWIKAINNHDVSRGTIMKAAHLLGKLSPVVTILAEKTTETFEEEEETKEDEVQDVSKAEAEAAEEAEQKEEEEEKEAEEATQEVEAEETKDEGETAVVDAVKVEGNDEAKKEEKAVTDGLSEINLDEKEAPADSEDVHED